jgi:hypothetical protein
MACTPFGNSTDYHHISYTVLTLFVGYVQHAVIYHFCYFSSVSLKSTEKQRGAVLVKRPNVTSVCPSTTSFTYTLTKEEFTMQINMLSTHRALQWFFSPVMCDNSISFQLTCGDRNHAWHQFPDELFLQNMANSAKISPSEKILADSIICV